MSVILEVPEEAWIFANALAFAFRDRPVVTRSDMSEHGGRLSLSPFGLAWEMSMALPDAYVVGTKDIAGILTALQTAGIPDRVTFEFLKTIGFKSSND